MHSITVEVRTDNVLTSSGTDGVTPERVRELHEWPDGDELPTADEPVTVAVMDSGIHPELLDHHPWFSNVEVPKRYDASGSGVGDDVGHGSGVASIVAESSASLIAALTGDETPVEFYDVRIFGDSGRTGFGAIHDAYEWLTDHADEIDLVNMSWGARRNTPPINQLHDTLLEQGVHDVVAAGNTGGDGGSPATAKSAFSAGAVTIDGTPARFSSLDPERGNPDVAAMGVDALMARAPGTNMGQPVDDQFTVASGTSFSSPYTIAAYVIALYQERASWDTRFEEAAPDIPGTEKDGSGLLKLGRTLDDDSGPEPEPDLPTTEASAWNFLNRDTIFLNDDWLPSGAMKATRVDDTGRHTTIRFDK